MCLVLHELFSWTHSTVCLYHQLQTPKNIVRDQSQPGYRLLFKKQKTQYCSSLNRSISICSRCTTISQQNNIKPHLADGLSWWTTVWWTDRLAWLEKPSKIFGKKASSFASLEREDMQEKASLIKHACFRPLVISAYDMCPPGSCTHCG